MNREEAVNKFEELIKEGNKLRRKWCKLMNEYDLILLEKMKTDIEFNNYTESTDIQNEEFVASFLKCFDCEERKERQERILDKIVEKLEKNKEETDKLGASFYTELTNQLDNGILKELKKGDGKIDTQHEYKM